MELKILVVLNHTLKISGTVVAFNYNSSVSKPFLLISSCSLIAGGWGGGGEQTVQPSADFYLYEYYILKYYI